MKEFKLDDNVNVSDSNVAGSNLPVKKGFWGKVKGFLFQEIDLSKPIALSPKTEKVFGEVHDFLFQEVKFPELHDFLFQEITLWLKVQ